MSYVIVSFNHKNSSISFLEKISFNSDDIVMFSSIVMENKDIKEIVILSTCNRVELFMVMDYSEKKLSFILSSLASYFSIDLDELQGHGDSYQDVSAINHLFCVASSLESMVVGETQITGQLKSAFKLSCDHNLSGDYIRRAIHFAFKCSSSIRKSSDISKNSVSIASISVLKLEENFTNLENEQVIIIGAGEMSALVMKNLVDKNMNIYLFNRTLEHIKTFKNKYPKNVTIKHLDDLKDYINDINILFTATGSSKPIITDDLINNSTTEKLWFDLALPKDVCIDSAKHQNIKIFSIEDLEEIAKKNTKLREEQAQIAYSLVGKNLEEFVKWQKELDVSPLLKEIREKAKNISRDEIKKAINKNFIKIEDEKNIEKLIHVIFNKFLHSVNNNLRKISNEPNADSTIDNMKFLFDLHNKKDKC